MHKCHLNLPNPSQEEAEQCTYWTPITHRTVWLSVYPGAISNLSTSMDMRHRASQSLDHQACIYLPSSQEPVDHTQHENSTEDNRGIVEVVSGDWPIGREKEKHAAEERLQGGDNVEKGAKPAELEGPIHQCLRPADPTPQDGEDRQQI